MREGARFGPYEIVAPLGAGGMGEVYRARDTRLGRDVAIKHSTERFSDRFAREAHAIASLNHAHICTLYDVGPDYLVMELIDGKPLRGPLPLKTVLEYGAQIADALQCAHSKGIVHRDLKPGNILVTKSGIKLLDFGLAKVAAPSPSAETTAETSDPLTKGNAILGTLQYMSPEQLEGKSADTRSDIFAFGLVLFEMISGKPAFQAASQASLIAAILKEEPAPLPPTEPVTPPALDRLLQKCLAKDPDARWQSAADLRDELEWVAQMARQSGAAPAMTQRARWQRQLLMSLATIIIAVLAFTAGRLLSPHSDTIWAGQRLGGPEFAFGPRISPDEHTLAFQAMVGQCTQVAVMKPESGNWQLLTGKSDAGWVNVISWAPDGNKLYFDRIADVPLGIYSVPALGGDEQLELQGAFAPEALPDGSLLIVKLNEERRFQLFRLGPDGKLQAFAVVLGSSLGMGSVINSTLVRASRDGREAFVVGRQMAHPDEGLHLYAIDLVSGAVRRVETGLQDNSAITALAPGEDGRTILAAVQSSELVRVVSFAKSGSTPPRTLLTVTGSLAYLDSGPGGTIYADQWAGSRAVLRFSQGRGQPERLASFPAFFNVATVLHDGRIVIMPTAPEHSQLLLVEPGKQPIALVNTNEQLASPVTVAGPDEIAFLIGPASARSIAFASTANGRITRRIRIDKGQISSLAASPDGKTIYCAADGAVWSIPQEGEPRRICAGDEVAIEPSGQSLLVKLIENPRVRLLRVPLDGAPPREVMLTGPLHLSWHHLDSSSISADGRVMAPLASPDSWFYVPGTIDLNTGKVTRLPLDFFGDYSFLASMPGGQILAAANEWHLSLWKFRPAQ